LRACARHTRRQGQDILRCRQVFSRSIASCIRHNLTRHSVITGVSKKGKIFKTLDCATYDVIRSMHFAANRLLVADLRSCKYSTLPTAHVHQF
jgi:hypothetical protein